MWVRLSLFARLARVLVDLQPAQLAPEHRILIGEGLLVELVSAVVSLGEHLGIGQPELVAERAVRLLRLPAWPEAVQPDRAPSRRRLERLPEFGFLVRQERAGARFPFLLRKLLRIRISFGSSSWRGG
jgi:hypothetical protein